MAMLELLAKAAKLPAMLDSHRRDRLIAWFERLLLIGGTAAWLAAHASLLYVVWTRPSLVHMDDAYVYVTQGATMRDCLFQDCPALTDLREQVDAPSTDHAVKISRWRTKFRVQSLYAPVYAGVLALLNAAGASWEDAFRIMWTVGVFVLGLGIAYWLSTLWGGGAAGLAMLLLALRLRETELFIITPNVFVFPIAMVIWGRLAAKNGRAPIAVLAGIPIMIAMHRSGLVHSGATIAMFALLAERPWTPGTRRTIWAACGLVFVAVMIPVFVKAPYLTFPLEPWPHDLSGIFDGVQKLPRILAMLLARWGDSFGSLAATVALAFVGFCSLSKVQQRMVGYILLPILVIAFLSLGMISFEYGPDGFRRWGFVIINLALTGGAARGLMQIFKTAARWVTGTYDEEKAGSGFWASVSPPARWFAVGLGILLLLNGSAQAVTKFMDGWRETYFYLRDNDDVSLNLEQAKLLRERARSGDRVLYFDYSTLPFFLTHGMMKQGALFYPAFRGTAEEARWINHPGLRFAVPLSPVERLPISEMGALAAQTVDYLELRGDPERLRALRIWVDNPRGGTHLVITAGGQSAFQADAARAEQRLPVNAAWSGWVSIKVPAPATHVDIRLPPAEPHLRVAGISTGASTFWPWDESLSVTVHTRKSDSPVLLNFSLRALLPAAFADRPVRVVNDWGSVVLIETGQ